MPESPFPVPAHASTHYVTVCVRHGGVPFAIDVTDQYTWVMLIRELQAASLPDKPTHGWHVRLGSAPLRRLAGVPGRAVVWRGERIGATLRRLRAEESRATVYAPP